MRVISQDGKSDVPYERYSITVIKDDYRDIYHVVCDYSEKSLRKLAKYSTEAKAIKAIEMCRKRYAIAEYNRRIIPKGDTPVMETAKELLTSGFIFQFPQDDEIEV